MSESPPPLSVPVLTTSGKVLPPSCEAQNPTPWVAVPSSTPPTADGMLCGAATYMSPVPFGSNLSDGSPPANWGSFCGLVKESGSLAASATAGRASSTARAESATIRRNADMPRIISPDEAVQHGEHLVTLDRADPHLPAAVDLLEEFRGTPATASWPCTMFARFQPWAPRYTTSIP